MDSRTSPISGTVAYRTAETGTYSLFKGVDISGIGAILFADGRATFVQLRARARQAHEAGASSPSARAAAEGCGGAAAARSSSRRRGESAGAGHHAVAAGAGRRAAGLAEPRRLPGGAARAAHPAAPHGLPRVP